jgi:hypothetical protein
MTALPFVRTSMALILATLAFAARPFGGGIAEAKVWAAHPTQFAPPSTARHATFGPVRAHSVVTQHTALVAPRRMVTGPVRSRVAVVDRAGMLHGMPVGTTPNVHARTPMHNHMIAERGIVRAVPTRAALTPVSRMHAVEDSPNARLAHLVPHLGALGPLKSHPTLPPPIAERAHPMASGAIPPSQRLSVPRVWIPPMVQHHAGRR